VCTCTVIDERTATGWSAYVPTLQGVGNVRGGHVVAAAHGESFALLPPVPKLEDDDVLEKAIVLFEPGRAAGTARTSSQAPHEVIVA